MYEHALKGWPKHGETELQPYQRRADQLTIVEECLLWSSRVIIPHTLRNKILNELHEDHVGASRMKAIARGFVWWPCLDKDIEDTVRACQACQDTRHRPVQTHSHPWIYPDAPWSRLHADFAEVSGKQYLVIVDAFSKWPEVHELGTHGTSTQTIEAFWRTFACHGLPERLVTDNGPQFTSQQFQEFMKANRIKHQLTPPYHPSSNGQAERLVQEVKKSLKTKPSSRTVSHQLSIFLLQYRTTPNCTMGKTPAELLMKKELRTRLSFLRPESRKTLREEHRDHYDLATEQVRNMSPGDTASVLKPRRDGRGKWLCGTILQRLGPVNYLVDVYEQPRYVHVEHLLNRDPRSIPDKFIKSRPEHDVIVPTLTPSNATTRDQSVPVRPTDAGTPVEVDSQRAYTPVTTTRPTAVVPVPVEEETMTTSPETPGSQERRYPQRQNRQKPARYR